MDEKVFQQAEKLAARNYSVIVSADKLLNGKEIYMAKSVELFGCMAQGATIEDAVDNLSKARVDYIYDSLINNVPVPDPASIAVRTVDDAVVMNTENFKVEVSKNFEKILEQVVQPKNRQQLYEASIRT